MCIVTEVPTIRKLSNEGTILMQHEEVILRTKKKPASSSVNRTGSCAPRSLLKRGCPTSGKRKSVRFAPDIHRETQGCCPEAAEDFVLVTHQDAAAEEPNPQEDELTRPVLSEVCCLLTPSSEMTPQEKSHVWWQARDYEVFKGTARLISSEIRRRTEASSSPLRSNSGSESYATVLTRSLDSCRFTPLHNDNDHIESSHTLPARLFAYLTHWIRVGHSRRGLERWSISSHSENRNAARENAIRTVLGEQDQLRVEAEDERCDGRDAMVRGLRSVSRQATRSARIFALAIGQADAAAVGSDVCDPSVHNDVKTRVPPPDLESSPRSVVPKANIVIV